MKAEIRISMPEDEFFKKDNRLRRHDASNYIKPLEDAIHSNLGIDDTNNIEVSLIKGYNEDNIWWIEYHLTESSRESLINPDTRNAYYKEDADYGK